MGRKQRRHEILMRLLGAGANIAGQAAGVAGQAISSEVSKRKDTLRKSEPENFQGDKVTNQKKAKKLRTEGVSPTYDKAQRDRIKTDILGNKPAKYGDPTYSKSEESIGPKEYKKTNKIKELLEKKKVENKSIKKKKGKTPFKAIRSALLDESLENQQKTRITQREVEKQKTGGGGKSGLSEWYKSIALLKGTSFNEPVFMANKEQYEKMLFINDPVKRNEYINSLPTGSATGKNLNDYRRQHITKDDPEGLKAAWREHDKWKNVASFYRNESQQKKTKKLKKKAENKKRK